MFLLAAASTSASTSAICCFPDAANASSRYRGNKLELRGASTSCRQPSLLQSSTNRRRRRRRLGAVRAVTGGNGDGSTELAPPGYTYSLKTKDIRCVVLDIEGTTTPISFVTDVLFPYARENVREHLQETYHTPQTQADIALLRAQVDQDLLLADQPPGTAVPLPPPDGSVDQIIDALVANVEAMIDADRKVGALKQLQGRIWRRGFDSGEIKGVVYDDVPPALAEWHGATGGLVKTYIYSSGSREAQRLIFGNTAPYGDLRKYLSAFFDTNVGGKRDSGSYYEIWQSLGVDSPSQILFLTDVCQEATAAKDAGLEVLISIRPGNAPLPKNHGFQTITSFAQIST